MSGFCLKCRAHVDVGDAHVSKGARIANLVLQGACPNCGTTIYRISPLRSEGNRQR